MTSNKLDRSAVWRVFAILRRFTLKLQNPLKFSLMLYLNLFTILLDDMLCLIKLFFWQYGDQLLPLTKMAVENLINGSCLSFSPSNWYFNASSHSYFYWDILLFFIWINFYRNLFTGNYNSSVSVSMGMLWCWTYLFFFIPGAFCAAALLGWENTIVQICGPSHWALLAIWSLVVFPHLNYRLFGFQSACSVGFLMQTLGKHIGNI